jgi:GNAT superfamily N-acetyltransferase
MMKPRLASVSDLPELSRLFDLYRQFYKQTSDLKGAEQFLSDRLNKNQSVIFVFEKTHGLGGFVQLYPGFSSIGMKSTWILNDLFVDSNSRKLGIGEALIKKAIDFSQGSGARNLMLQTAVTNIFAQKLYERLGWVRDEKYYTYYFSHS